ncbi:hypothetical protein [Odoribacter sp. Z80]|uniref:hypothetical protein n=1 Tax=Odoribacter sp. Z80 TaxID=2304575 RepID=UPI0013795333|nr:hypothetical protein [Odoribacter sp. Z80]
MLVPLPSPGMVSHRRGYGAALEQCSCGVDRTSTAPVPHQYRTNTGGVPDYSSPSIAHLR